MLLVGLTTDELLLRRSTLQDVTLADDESRSDLVQTLAVLLAELLWIHICIGCGCRVHGGCILDQHWIHIVGDCVLGTRLNVAVLLLLLLLLLCLLVGWGMRLNVSNHLET